mmetsp:Transcript_11101/g.17027  ORF Transcript_11101/g.17027 Transcript_11101/m.17027 type:complete len:322 (+) Transcript_11101:2-967(+)
MKKLVASASIFLAASPMTTTTTNNESTHTIFVWDFDWTIVNCNSDEYVPAQFLGSEEVNEGFRSLLSSGNDWHACVEAMIRKVIKEKGAKRDDVLGAARKMPYLENVRKALDDIKVASSNKNCGQMILSDGNTLFIGAFLEENGLSQHFPHGIVSNIGVWDEHDNNDEAVSLRVEHQSQKYGGHDCSRCSRSPNLCKTQALQDTIMLLQKTNVIASCDRPRIVYIGDGANDACPVLNVLREGDTLLARSGGKRTNSNACTGQETDKEATTQTEGVQFGIVEALRRAREDEFPIIPKCQVREWRTGLELRQLIRGLLDVISD